MALANHSTSEISLRHLPDISESDASFSFQIPQVVNSADLLLANTDDNDFFGNGQDDSFATPAPPKRILDNPLTLSQLTPKPQESAITPALSSSPSRPKQNTKSRTATSLPPEKQKIRFGNEVAQRRTRGGDAIINSPVGAQRFADLRAGVEFLVKDAMEDEVFAPSKLAMAKKEPVAKPVATRVDEAAKVVPGGGTKIEPTVTEGVITKTVVNAEKLPHSKISTGVTTAASRPSKLIISPGRGVRIRPDIVISEKIASTSGSSMTMAMTTGGVAERLLQYGQTLITNNDGDFEKVEDPSKEAEAVIEEPSPVPPCPNLTANPASPPRVPSYADDPFTLSQISPQKEQDPSHVSSSRSTRFPHPATRTATKRPASPTADTSSLAPQRKKGKEEPLLRAPITRARTRGLSKSGPSGVSSARSRPGPHEKQARLRQTPVGQASTSENLNGVPPPLPTAGLSSRNPGISVVRSTKRDGNQTAKAVGVGLGSSSTISKSLSSTVPGPLANSTKPVEFTFRSDVRLEARKAEVSQQRPLSQAMSTSESERRGAKLIPDFKALHAAELQASMAFREQRHVPPTVPVAPELTTETRAREREKFDEAVRRKEEEMERVREERRRVREEEEEREVKEMRRKAVPRAHEVPEWYADAPKRAGASQR